MTIEHYTDGFVLDSEPNPLNGSMCDHCTAPAVEYVEQSGSWEYFCGPCAAEYLGPQVHGYVDY